MRVDRAADDAESGRGQLGLLATGASVVGGIIGTGIFTVPAAVAEFGWMAYPAFAVVTVGSVMLAVTFGALARDDPRDGGPAYGYAQQAFGPFTGFLSAWSYWIQGWTGQATISVAGAGYLIALIGVSGLGVGARLRRWCFAVAAGVGQRRESRRGRERPGRRHGPQARPADRDRRRRDRYLSASRRHRPPARQARRSARLARRARSCCSASWGWRAPRSPPDGCGPGAHDPAGDGARGPRLCRACT